MQTDSFRTIVRPSEALFKDKSSRFLAFAYPVTEEQQIKEMIDALRKKYYDATHHCYAWRLGAHGQMSRSNDDGEPSGTAGRPILGQMLSANITNCLIIVVRYFGGTKLGVSGLIAAYREAAAEVIAAAEIEVRTVDKSLTIHFPYIAINEVMKIVKEMQPEIIAQEFDNLCSMTLSIRESKSLELKNKLKNANGVSVVSE